MEIFQSELLKKAVSAMRLTTDNYDRKNFPVCWQMLGCSQSCALKTLTSLEGLM